MAIRRYIQNLLFPHKSCANPVLDLWNAPDIHRHCYTFTSLQVWDTGKISFKITIIVLECK